MNSTIDHRAAAANRTSDTLAILDTLARLAQAQDDSDTDGYRACFMETVLIDQPMIAGWQPKWISSTEWAKIALARSEEHTSELQSLMRISYDVFCLKKKNNRHESKQQRQTTKQ